MRDDALPDAPAQPTTPASGEGVTLFCPHCDYNLTGLPENRCPECGRRFDPKQLLAEAAAGPRYRPKPISAPAMMLYLLGGSVFLCGGAFLDGIASTRGAAWLAGMFAAFLYVLVSSGVLVGRVIATRAEITGRDPDQPGHPLQKVGLWLLFCIVQLLLLIPAMAAVQPLLGPER